MSPDHTKEGERPLFPLLDLQGSVLLYYEPSTPFIYVMSVIIR